LYWNGFVRLKTAIAPGTGDYKYGTSVVLGPFLPVEQDPAMVAKPDLHPRITTINFDSASLTNGAPTADATGGWYSGAGVGAARKDIDVAWHLSWTAKDATSTRMEVAVDATALNDIVLPHGRLGYGGLSSMWASASVHDSDTYTIGPKDAPLVTGSAASVNPESTPVTIGPRDWLSLITTSTTTHNSGSPEVSLQITVNP
jgi:hypothetical protein